MNTKINYLYRDADNYKVHNECVVQGTISAEQIAVVLECLDEGEYFIPHLVGLPEKRFDTFDPQVDHPYFELSEDSFEETMEPATVEVKADELVSAFLNCKGKWEQIDPDRTVELLNMPNSATALFLRFSDGEDHSKFMARNTSLLVIHNTQNKEEQSCDSMCRYQFLGDFPTANLTSNPQKMASHRKFNLNNCAIKKYKPQYIVVRFFKN